MQHRLIHLAVSAAILGFTFGCTGDDGSYQGATGTVSGVVKIDGKPLTEKATVTFITKEGFVATGQTDGSGKFTLKYKQSSEIPVGKYAVAVMPAAGAASSDPKDFMDEESGETKVAEAKTTIPKKVQSPGGSGITKEIKEGEQTIDIEI